MVCPKCNSKKVYFKSYYIIGKGYKWECQDCKHIFYAPFKEMIRKIRGRE